MAATTKKTTGHLSPQEDDASASMPAAGDLVLRATIIAIIAEKVKLPGEALRQSKDKVGHRLAYAIKNGKARAPANGRFVFGDVIRWARQRQGWGDKLAGLPESAPIPATPKSVTVRASHEAAYARSADSLKECKALLAHARQENTALIGQLRAALEELQRLRPLAEMWQTRIVEKNRRNARGKKGGTK